MATEQKVAWPGLEQAWPTNGLGAVGKCQEKFKISEGICRCNIVDSKAWLWKMAHLTKLCTQVRSGLGQRNVRAKE